MAATIVEHLAPSNASSGFQLAVRTGDVWNWRPDWRERALRYAAALARLGVGPGDMLALIAENSLDWVVIDLAAHALGAILAPLHPNQSPAQLARQLAHSQARTALLGDAALAARLATANAALPAELQWLALTPAPHPATGAALPVLPELALAEATAAGETLLHRRLAAVQPSDLATLLYTSGATGEPLGVLLTEGNLAANATAVLGRFGLRPDECRLNVLPLSHIFARTCDLYVSLVGGTRLALAAARDDLFRLAQWPELGVTLFNGVPLIFERLLAAAAQAQAPLRSLLGPTVRYANSGGAPLPPSVLHAAAAEGLELLEGYGLTEAGPVVSLTPPGAAQEGSVGWPLFGIGIRFADDGELLIRGPSVMPGYWRNPAATAAALQDGWLHTGDIVRLGEGGRLYLTGRKKDLLATSAGKKIAPAPLEALLSADPIVAQVCVVGEGWPCLAALVVPHLPALAEALAASDLPPLDASAALEGELQRRDLRDWLLDRLAARLAGAPGGEQLRRLALLATPFTLESGELTAKLSLRRHAIIQERSSAIAAAFGADGQ